MSEARPKAVVLLSGGMDSAVTAALAALERTLCLFHLNYGQLTEEAEQKTFSLLARHFAVVDLMVAHTNFFRMMGGASLTDPSIPVSPANLESKEIPTSYTPFRNAVLLAMACGWAERLGAREVWYGAVQEDSSGYPDCSETFVHAFQEAVSAGTKPGSGIRIVAPLLHKSKAEIIRAGLKLGVPFHLTWSCYKNNESPCGDCDSCALRARGFAEAREQDPLAKAPAKGLPPVAFATSGKGDAVWEQAKGVKIRRLNVLLKALAKRPA